jgi:hypothetical protein
MGYVYLPGFYGDIGPRRGPAAQRDRRVRAVADFRRRSWA